MKNEEYRMLGYEFTDAPGTSEETRLEFMKIERLDRIASALERLAGCVDHYKGDRLYIAGEISNADSRY